MVLYCSCWMEFLHQNTKQTCGFHVFQVTTHTAVGLQTYNCKLHFSNNFSSWSLYSTDKISLQLNVCCIIFMYFQIPWFEWKELSVEEQERYLAKKIWEEFKEEVSCTVRWIVLWYWQQEWVTELIYKYRVIFGVDWFLSCVVLTEVIIFFRHWFFHLYRRRGDNQESTDVCLVYQSCRNSAHQTFIHKRNCLPRSLKLYFILISSLHLTLRHINVIAMTLIPTHIYHMMWRNNKGNISK